MLRRLVAVLAFAFALSLTAVFAAGCAEEAREADALRQSISSFIEHEMATKEIPSLSIALVDGDETLWTSGFGPGAGGETVYRVGSVSKLFTDMAVMQLVERGELDIDAPLSDYLPELSFASEVTLRQLMSHHAGLVREPPVGNYFDPTEPSLADTIASLVPSSSGRPRKRWFAPMRRSPPRDTVFSSTTLTGPGT